MHINENAYMISFHNVDLSPKPGKSAWTAGHREWQEKFIYFLLAGVIKGQTPPGEFIKHYDALQRSVLSEGKYGELMVSSIDDHQRAGGEIKRWLSFNACPKQVIAGMGFELCAMGTPGEGNSYEDWEAMFTPDEQSTNMLSQRSYIYREITAIAALCGKEAALRHGTMHFRQTSAERRNFHFSDSPQGVLAFSRILSNEEILVVYNSAVADAKEEYVLVDPGINKDKQQMRYIYGRKCGVEIQQSNGASFVKLYLEPKQLVILKSN